MIEVRNSQIDKRGVFASAPIKRGTFVIEYGGEWIDKEEGSRRYDEHMEQSKQNPQQADVLIFDYDEQWDIDGSVSWNDARYINHSCDPNTEAVDHAGGIWFKAMRDIEPGEEITFDYGYDEEMFDATPCLCRTSKCVGYLLGADYWDKLPKLLEKFENSKSELPTS